MELQPCSRFEWERIVRRCPLPGMVKLLAYTLAQYGSPQGRDIRPGTPRLAAVCCMGARTVERNLSTLRRLGLVERVSNGGGPNRLAAVYRLTVPDDLLERLELLQPDEVTPATTVAAVVPIKPVDNASSPAAQEAGDAWVAEAELPPSGEELPPNPAPTPATQVADHHTTTQLTPPSRSPESLSHLRDQLPRGDPDDPHVVRHPRCHRPGCLGGWLHAPGADDAPTPCPTCKPHLRPVRDQPRETA